MKNGPLFMLKVKEVNGRLCVSTYWISLFAVIGVVSFVVGIGLSLAGVLTVQSEQSGVYQVHTKGGYANLFLFWPGMVLTISIVPLLAISCILLTNLCRRFGIKAKNVDLFSWVELTTDKEVQALGAKQNEQQSGNE